MTEEEYKSKVSTAKDTVAKMIEFGEQNDIGAGELENDIETYLEEQGLTFFDLKTDGNRREASYTTAFTNAFNNRLSEILQVVVPEVASTLDVKKFFITDLDQLLERDKEVKEGTKKVINDLFTKEIPGIGMLTDQGYTPETLGERMADQAGEDLINFLPLVIAPNVLAMNGPVKGYQMTVGNNPGIGQKIIDTVSNSTKNVLNTYIANPTKAFLADVTGTVGFGAGTRLGQEVTEEAERAESVGYTDAAPLVETATGLGGATVAVLGTEVLTSPYKTKRAISSIFSSYFGLKPLLGSFSSRIKKKNERKAADFFRETMENHEKDLTQADDINRVTDNKLTLTTAEQTQSPGLAAEQEAIERAAAGADLDKAVERRATNVKTLDEALNASVPEADKDFQTFIDLRDNKVINLAKDLEEQIVEQQTKLVTAAGRVQPKLTAQESGANLRAIIEDAQLTDAQKVITSLDNLPEGSQVIDASILEDVLALTSRDFQMGTEPTVLNILSKKIKEYLPSEKIVDGETITLPPKKELKNQDLFDIWLTASMEETALLGKAGVPNAAKLQKVSQIKSQIYDTLVTNLENVEGAPTFFNNLDNYINKFEQGVLLRVREKKPAGYPIKDEAVADAFFQSQNVQAMNDFVRVFGNNPEAVVNMQNAILDRLINESLNTKTGLLDMDQFKRFMTKYDTSLAKLGEVSPEFLETLNNTPKALTEITARLATLEKRKTFLEGEKLKDTLKIFGSESKKLKLGTTEEYVNAALNDPKVMSNITERAISNGAEDAWAKAVMEQLTGLRVVNEKGAISPAEITNMKKFLETNKDSLGSLFNTLGNGYKDHYKNLELIVDGFSKANFVRPPKGSPAPTPSAAMKETLGTDVPQVWSRVFAVASNRTGYKFVGAELFNRFLNTIGSNHFDKLVKQAIYDPQFARTLANMNTSGKNATVGDIKNIYGFFAKINGTIGTASEFGNQEYTVQDEVRAETQDKEVGQAPVTMAPTPNVSFSPNTESRLATANIVQPVDVPRARTTDVASINPDTMARGQQIFGADDPIFGMAKGGIMNSKRAFQRVA